MKKFLSVIAILVLIIIGVKIIFPEIVSDVYLNIYNYYYDNYSTSGKMQKYIKTNNIKKLKKLKLDKKINEFFKSHTPMYYAIESDNADVVKYFIEIGADVNAPTAPTTDCTIGCKGYIFRGTPLQQSFIKENSEIIRLLTENGADVSEKRILAYVEKQESIDILKAAGAKETLFSAIIRNDTESVKEQINNGANVNEKDKGDTPLSLAEKTGNAEIIELLKSAGAK